MATSRDGQSLRRRLRVLHVVVPSAGATADVALGYVRDQVERGWNVTVACASEGPLGFAARAAGAGVIWWPAAPGTGLRALGELSRLAAIVDTVTPDVVHLHGGKAGALGRLVVRDKVPTVYQPHVWSFLEAGGASRRVELRWERAAVRWTGELICLSEAERRAGVTAGVIAPTSVLPPSVDLARLQPQEDGDRRAARAALRLPDAPTAVAVGPLGRPGGVSQLRQVWAVVRSRVPEARLVVVAAAEGGPADPDPADQPLVEEEEGISVVRGRADPERWLSAADVVLSPPSWTAVTSTPWQAMACARSLVLADATGVVEGLVPGEAGAVTPAGDLEAFATAVVRRLRDPGLTEDEGWNGRSRVEQRHDETSSARALSRVYLRLVGVRRGR